MRLWYIWCICVWMKTVDGTSEGRRIYRITARAQTPYLFHKPRAPYGADGFEGLLVDLLHRMSSILGVQFVFDHVGDSTFGEREDGESWNGMTGELMRNDSDIAIGPLTITAKRAGMLKFTQPYIEHGYRLLMQKPPSSEKATPGINDMTLPLEPFPFLVWAVLVSSFCVVVFLHALDLRYNKRNNYYRRRKRVSILMSALHKTITISVGDPKASTKASRYLRIVWAVFVCWVLLLYITQLNVILMYRSHRTSRPLPFHSFQGLVAQTEVQYGSSLHTFELFKNSSQPVVQAIHNYLITRKQYFKEPISEKLHEMESREGKYAIILESDLAYFISSKEPCDKIVVGEELGKQSHVFACRYDLDICRDIDVAISLLKSSGELNNLLYRWRSGACGKYEDISSNFYGSESRITQQQEGPLKLSLEIFIIPIAFFTFGVFLMVFIFILEMKILHVYQPNNRDTTILHKSWNIEMDNQ